MKRTIATFAALATLNGGAAHSETPTTTEPPRTVPERSPQWSPIGLGCSIIMLGLGAAANFFCARAPRPPVWHPDRWPQDDRPPRNVQGCQTVSTVGFGGLGVLCSFL
jgi:hypothetical protein